MISDESRGLWGLRINGTSNAEVELSGQTAVDDIVWAPMRNSLVCFFRSSKLPELLRRSPQMHLACQSAAIAADLVQSRLNSMFYGDIAISGGGIGMKDEACNCV